MLAADPLRYPVLWLSACGTSNRRPVWRAVLCCPGWGGLIVLPLWKENWVTIAAVAVGAVVTAVCVIIKESLTGKSVSGRAEEDDLVRF